MKRLIFAGMAVAAALHAQPSQADLQAALENAKSEWGVSADVTIRLEPAKGCGLYNAARRKNKKNPNAETTDLADLGEVMALATRHKDKVKTASTTTISFAAGDIDNGEEPVKISDDKLLTQTFVGKPVDSEELGPRVININAACNWDDREFLNNVVLHEYGHSIGIEGHSTDEHSVMYWMVFDGTAVKKYGEQKITAANRASLPTLTAVKQ